VLERIHAQNPVELLVEGNLLQPHLLIPRLGETLARLCQHPGGLVDAGDIKTRIHQQPIVPARPARRREERAPGFDPR
jgi:hypothetical protein